MNDKNLHTFNGFGRFVKLVDEEQAITIYLRN